ncbi:MAG: ZIP family metal transporter [Elusimicrobia bacterium]|nr:ZIP family metal transporter [Elusimicrobiota bacterium]
MREILYSLAAALAAMMGSFLVVRLGGWAKKNSLLLISFAAGVMITLSFSHFIPEALELTPNAVNFVLIGFFAMFFLQNIVMVHPCHDPSCDNHDERISVVGLSLHSLIDGLVISAGFEVSPQLGILTAIAVLLHKIPDGIVITSILVHCGANKKKTILLSLLVAAFTPIGTATGHLLLSNLPQEVVGMFLAGVAGSFIYLAASDLIPETHKAVNRRTVSSFLFLGSIFVLIISHFTH